MLAIEKYKGIKDAAQSLHISPPALSIFLSNLEERSGVHFFDRIGKQFIPTQAGKIYLEHARKIFPAWVKEVYTRFLWNDPLWDPPKTDSLSFIPGSATFLCQVSGCGADPL